MKKVLHVTAIVIAAFFARAADLADAVQTEDKATKEELLQIEGEWNDAYNRHDKEAVGRILSDDYTLIDADAYFLNKGQYLDTISRVQVKSENLKYPDVRVYGNAAIVISIWSGTYSFDGKETTDNIRYTDVFIRENGRWRAVASQGTRISKP
jgi:ketosteroid isomerase-like protein